MDSQVRIQRFQGPVANFGEEFNAVLILLPMEAEVVTKYHSVGHTQGFQHSVQDLHPLRRHVIRRALVH